MPLVQAYLCPRTDKFFLKKDDYVSHLKTLARESLDKKYHQKRLSEFHVEFDNIRKRVRSFNELSEILELNIKLMYDYAITKGGLFRPPPVCPALNNICIYNVSDNLKCSNTHSKPLNGVTNFGYKESLQKGYPGVQAEIKYNLSKDMRINDIFSKALGLCTGSGGGRGIDSYEYELTMFAEDWPFVAVKLLHKTRDVGLTEDMKRVLTYAFPGITTDLYESLQKTGVLPENLPDFERWMYQFVEPKEAAQTEDLELPVDVIPTL